MRVNLYIALSIFCLLTLSCGDSENLYNLENRYALDSQPIIDSVSGSFDHGETIIIKGSKFGDKPNAAPLYYSDLENEALGFTPSGWTGDDNQVITSDDFAWAGSRSLKVNIQDAGSFCQIVRDLGRTMTNLYFSSSLYIDRGDECAPIQFKAWRWSSSPGAYYPDEDSTTTAVLNAYFYYDTPEHAYWGNNNTWVYYDGSNEVTSTNSQEDLFFFNQWQRIEQFVKGSSAPNVPDGYLWTNRIGREGHV